MATKVLNIDALIAETPLQVTMGGVTHDMKVPTLDDYLVNMKELMALSAKEVVDPSDEVEMMIRMIARSFPTLDEKIVRGWPITAIGNLFDTIRSIDHATATDASAEPSAEGNAPTAS